MPNWRKALNSDFGFRIADCRSSNHAPGIRNPQSAIRNRKWRCSLIAILGAALLAAPGCREPQVSQSSRSQQNALQRADRGAALINNVAMQLSDLPSAVDTELRPPTVVLDASKTPDRQDIYAIALANAAVEGNPVNILQASPNGRFKSMGVRSGDIAKYYIVEDETVDEERQQAGFSRQLAKDLTIAQVVDNSVLIIEGSLPQPVPIPAKLEIWRAEDDRLEEINEKLVRYAERRLPPVGWEPTPDDQAIRQIVQWLNGWMRQSEPKSDWKRDPMLDALDPDLLANQELKTMLAMPALATQDFNEYDGRHLQEAVWLRDISRWAQGDDFNEIARATALFDWTIRNVQLMPDADAPPHRPWRTLAEGRGTVEERAWIFALLCRQQALDVVILELPAEAGQGGDAQTEGSDAQSPANPATRFWLPALVLNNELYLFDVRLGLPIPGPGGEDIATLQQVQQDDAILRQLDLEGSPYPVNAEAAKKAVVAMVASPFELSRRAQQLEGKLTGENHLVLTAMPSEMAAEIKTIPGVAGVKLWAKPFRTLHEQLTLGQQTRHREAIAFEPFAKRPLLWKARARHFQGRRERGARTDEEAIDDHREASGLYTRVRLPDAKLARISSPGERRVDTLAKIDATYWLGLLSFDEGKFSVAGDWLGRSNLADEGSPWQAGTRYNMARALEAQGQLEEAASLLEEGTSPQSHGNRLRARMLRAKAEAAKAEVATTDAE